MSTPVPPGSYRFGSFRLDPASRVLERDGTVVPMAPRTFDLLHCFVRSGGRLLTKHELLNQIWDEVNVQEASLAFQVSTLRKALGDEGTAWIETVPKHGYRFTASVREVRPDDTRDPAPLSTPLPARSRRVPRIWRWTAGVVAILAAVVLVWYASRRDSAVPPEIRLEAVPFTTYTGREAEPTFSPDAAQVAFTWDGESQDNYDIYVKALAAEQPLRLTSDPARDGSPAWSPDGTRIAFLRDKPAGGSELRLIAPTGGPERPLGEVQGLAHQGLSWSPDGRFLAVVDRSSRGEPLGIFVLDVASGVKKRLTPPTANNDILPAFSPDGRTIAFNRTVLPRGPFVHVVPVTGGEPRVLVPTGFPRGRLAWVPGGDEILFSAVPLARDGGQPRPSSGSNGSLWRVPAYGGQARLLPASENAVDVAVSADGRRLVYSQATTDLDIWRLDLRPGAATGESQARFASSTKNDANAQFSPDGERVAFTSDRSGQLEIWVADRQGRHPLRLTYQGSAAAPRWSPDGKTIAFNCDAKGEREGERNVDIYVISALGGPPRRVTTSPAIDATPSWSRDGRWIYFASNRSGRWQVWKVPSNGEEARSARQVTRGGGFAAIESTDGRHVYFTREMSGTLDPQSAIFRIPVEGGDEEVVVERYRSSHGSWDLTAEGLYFVDQEPSSSGMSWVVRFQAFDQRQATDVARLRYPPFLSGPAISVSSDGTSMLSTQSQEESDLMLVEHFR